MDEDQLNELYIIIKRAYRNSCWDTLQEAIDYIEDYTDSSTDEFDDE